MRSSAVRALRAAGETKAVFLPARRRGPRRPPSFLRSFALIASAGGSSSALCSPRRELIRSLPARQIAARPRPSSRPTSAGDRILSAHRLNASLALPTTPPNAAPPNEAAGLAEGCPGAVRAAGRCRFATALVPIKPFRVRAACTISAWHHAGSVSSQLGATTRTVE